jgi:hypothetical protein
VAGQERRDPATTGAGGACGAGTPSDVARFLTRHARARRPRRHTGGDTEAIMHNLFYIIGVIVVALIVLSLIA